MLDVNFTHSFHNQSIFYQSYIFHMVTLIPILYFYLHQLMDWLIEVTVDRITIDLSNELCPSRVHCKYLIMYS